MLMRKEQAGLQALAFITAFSKVLDELGHAVQESTSCPDDQVFERTLSLLWEAH